MLVIVLVMLGRIAELPRSCLGKIISSRQLFIIPSNYSKSKTVQKYTFCYSYLFIQYFILLFAVSLEINFLVKQLGFSCLFLSPFLFSSRIFLSSHSQK